MQFTAMVDPRTVSPTSDMDQEEDPAEQAAWEIATAETLRARGDLSEAASWYRRAANHLMEVGDDERAIEVAKLAAELVALESAVRPASQRGPSTASVQPPPAAPIAVTYSAPPVAAHVTTSVATNVGKANPASTFPQGARPLSQRPLGAAPSTAASPIKLTGQVPSPASRVQTPQGPTPAAGSAAAKIFGGINAPKTNQPLNSQPNTNLDDNSIATPALGVQRGTSVGASAVKLTGSVPAPRPYSAAPTTSRGTEKPAPLGRSGSVAPTITTGQHPTPSKLLPSASPQMLPVAPSGDDGGETSVISLGMIASPIASMLDEAVATMPWDGSSMVPSPTKRPLSFRPERAAEGESIAARLSALPLFSDLPADRLRVVARQLIVESRGADETLCESGAPEGPLYVLLSGTAWVGLAGKASPVALVSAGDFVGEIAALFGGPRTATVIAREPIETVAIAPSLVRSMAREFSSFRASLLEAITERMQEALPEISPCFRRLSDEARRDLMAIAQFVEIAEGDELMVEGEDASALFVVAAGEAECFGGELGVRHAVRVRVGEMMGAASVLGTAASGVTARASRALLVAKMEAKAVQQLLPLHATLRELLDDVTNPGKGVVC